MSLAYAPQVSREIQHQPHLKLPGDGLELSGDRLRWRLLECKQEDVGVTRDGNEQQAVAEAIVAEITQASKSQ